MRELKALAAAQKHPNIAGLCLGGAAFDTFFCVSSQAQEFNTLTQVTGQKHVNRRDGGNGRP